MPKKKKTNAAFLKMAQAPLKPSPQLAEVLGSAAPISRPQVAKKVWAYIKKHKLQDPRKRREIVADAKGLRINNMCNLTHHEVAQSSSSPHEKPLV